MDGPNTNTRHDSMHSMRTNDANGPGDDRGVNDSTNEAAGNHRTSHAGFSGLGFTVNGMAANFAN